jgi:hypothetical protein
MHRSNCSRRSAFGRLRRPVGRFGDRPLQDPKAAVLLVAAIGACKVCLRPSAVLKMACSQAVEVGQFRKKLWHSMKEDCPTFFLSLCFIWLLRDLSGAPYPLIPWLPPYSRMVTVMARMLEPSTCKARSIHPVGLAAAFGNLRNGRPMDARRGMG